jgi:hypothetical protein
MGLQATSTSLIRAAENAPRFGFQAKNTSLRSPDHIVAGRLLSSCSREFPS